MSFPDPDGQSIWSGVLSIATLVIGWVLSGVRDNLAEQRRKNETIAEKVHTLEVLVAGDYVKKSDLDTDIRRIFEKLDHIEAKLDQKVNRGEGP